MFYQRLVRIVLASVLFFVAFGTIACSFVIGFTIKNSSDRELIVAYNLRNADFGLEPELVEKNNSGERKYTKFPEDRLKVDFDNRSVEFRLLPSEEVQILRMQDRSSSEYEKAFNLTSLKLSSSDSKATFEGRQIFAQFSPIKASAFTFGPSVIGFELEYR